MFYSYRYHFFIFPNIWTCKLKFMSTQTFSIFLQIFGCIFQSLTILFNVIQNKFSIIHKLHRTEILDISILDSITIASFCSMKIIEFINRKEIRKNKNDSTRSQSECGCDLSLTYFLRDEFPKTNKSFLSIKEFTISSTTKKSRVNT